MSPSPNLLGKREVSRPLRSKGVAAGFPGTCVPFSVGEVAGSSFGLGCECILSPPSLATLPKHTEKNDLSLWFMIRKNNNRGGMIAFTTEVMTCYGGFPPPWPPPDGREILTEG